MFLPGTAGLEPASAEIDLPCVLAHTQPPKWARMPSRSFFALKPGRCCGSLAYRLQSHAVRNYRNETPSCHRSRACAGGTRTRAQALGAQLSPLSYSATVKAYIIFRGFVRIISADAGDDAAISFGLMFFLLFPVASSNYSGCSDISAVYAKTGSRAMDMSTVSPVNTQMKPQRKQLTSRYTGIPFNLSPPSVWI